jgi:hypothetical protein
VYSTLAEFVNAASCAVPAADLALFTARVKTSEISRVKSLHLVRVFPVLFLLYIFSACCMLLCVSALTCAVQGWNQICDDGAESIAAAVIGNTSLQSLKA